MLISTLEALQAHIVYISLLILPKTDSVYTFHDRMKFLMDSYESTLRMTFLVGI